MSNVPLQTPAHRIAAPAMQARPSGKHILVVEDEPDLQELLRYNLEKEGFVVDSALDGKEAYDKALAGRFDLVLLDLMLPAMNGLEVCRLIRAKKEMSTLPIVMLTARTDEIDRVLGLEMGADDYIAKPFSTRELIARINAVLRRSGIKQPIAREEGTLFHIRDLSLDSSTYHVHKGDRAIELSATEFNILRYLALWKGKIFSRNQILDAIWTNDVVVEPRTVDVHIRRIRMLIEDDAANPKYVKTRRGIGYYFAVDDE